MTKTSKAKKTRSAQRQARHARIRRKIRGTSARPRLVVFRSLRNMEAQLVDDVAGTTLVGVSSLTAPMKDFKAEGGNPRVEQAFAVGKLLAERARAAGITAVVFDRGGYQYHGRVQALADGAREGGLEF